VLQDILGINQKDSPTWNRKSRDSGIWEVERWKDFRK